MKILLLGKNGQLGHELQRSLGALAESAVDSAAEPVQLFALDRSGAAGFCGDLGNLQGLAETVRAFKPTVIVNAAAYTAVDQAESEPDRARLINVEAPALLAEEAQKLGAWLVHYSSDYVFDGSAKAPWQETDTPAPLNVYGQTKLAGEQAVVCCDKHLVFRTSWVYAAQGKNFIKTMLHLAQTREQLSVIDDQVGAPTGASLLADVTAQTLRASKKNHQLAGLYHLAPRGETNWHAYACFVIEKARQAGVAIRVSPEAITAIPTCNYPTPAQRPLNSRLDTRKLQERFNIHLPEWQAGVEAVLRQILKSNKDGL